VNELEGLNCLITGACRGLGRKLATTYWQAGASLFLTARSSQALDGVAASLPARAGQNVAVFPADLADPEVPARIVDECRRFFASLEILVNNAATQGPIGVTWENDSQEWLRTIRVDLLAPVEICRLCVPWMAARRRGKVINLSGGGAASPRPRFSAYAAAKAALVRFSETLAEEARELGIDVNCVAPGAMDTDMLNAILTVGAEKSGAGEHRRAKDARKGGEDAMEKAAALCTFLASPASDGITGKLLSAVWDPWESLADHREDLAGSDVYTLRRILPKDRGWDWGDRGG
jgi:NAD(P)-dependent dehydrogenase (short-subunit alcohol dehydrogenase family)